MEIHQLLSTVPIWIPLLLSMTISIHHICKHLTNFHEPRLQLYIVRIILMIPIYSLQAFLSLQFPMHSLYFDALKDCYEAYVIYIFLQLLIQYMGGEQIIVAHFEKKERMTHPWPLRDYVMPIHLHRHFFRNVKRGILQFVFVKPFVSFLAIVLSSQHKYDDGSINISPGYLFCIILNNLSITISLYCLVYFYLATEDRLKSYNPFWKFFMIKSVVFFSYWQTLAMSVLLKFGFFGDPIDPKNVELATLYQNTMILFEMVVAGIAFSLVFTYSDFLDWTKQPKPILSNLSKVLSMRDLIKDAKTTFVDDEEEYERPLKDMDEDGREKPEYGHFTFEPRVVRFDKYL